MPTAPGTSRDVDQDQENQEQAQSPLESMMQRYAPDKLTQYQTALNLRDGASDDEARMAARRLSQVIIGVDSVDGQIWNRGVPFKTGRDYHAAMVKADNDLRTFAPQDLKEWNETEDMEKRFEIAKEKLGKFHGFRTGVENVVQQLKNPALTDDELRGAPEEIIQANEKVMAVTRTGKYGMWAGEPGTGRPFEVPAITEEEGRSALETVKQYREQRNKASIMAQYEGQLLSRNAWYHYLAARENWSPAADKIAQDVMKHGTMHPAQMDRFQTLPLPEQRELANFIHSAKRAGTANLPADMWQSFKDMLVDVPLDAARHATVDSVRRMFMDDDEYQKFAEERAILNQLEAPKMAEYGYMGQSAIGFASTIPYMGYAAIPKVGISIVAAKAAADFEDRVAAEGGDVTSAKFIGAKWGMAYAYAAVEKMQAMRLGKPLSSLEYRQALLQFWRPANAAIVAKIVAGNTVHETWEEGVQAGIEEGFVAWGLEKDIAKSAAGGLVQELKDTAGTMFLTSLAGAGGASVKARASKTHNINELITSQWHLMGLHDSMRNKDEKERKRHMQALGGIFRQWYEAGSHENAVEQFMARGMDRQTANELSGFIGMQHDAIMHDPDIQQSEKNAAFGLRRITPDVVRDIHPNATIADNGDGTFSISQDWNGKRVQFTVNQDWKPLQDINAANFAASVTEALQAVGEDMSVDKWTAMPEAEKLAMIEKYNIQVEGQFQVVAGDTSVTEGQAATLSGQIDLQENAHPATVFHEQAHGFYAFARRSGMFSEQDVQKLREEFGDPRPGVDEDFNEEAAADAWRDFAAGKTRFTQSGILERAFDWIQDTVSGIAKARRRAEKEQTTRDSLLMQMYRGEFTGIPVGTITEAQRRENAKAKEKAKPKTKKPAAKPQEPTAQEPQQAQDAPEAEIQPDGQAEEKPPSGEAVAGQGEDAESAAASADLDELEAPDVQPEATRQKLPGEHVAFTPGGEHQITAELVVVRRSDLIPSSDKRYPQRLQPRDVNAVGRRAQVHKIARNPQLSRIVEGSNTSDGYIYIDQNGNILSGNGRYAGISEAISIGTLTQAQLDAFMRNQAVKEGVVVPDGFSDILVVAMIRDLPDGLTLERFAELSNRNAILQRSEAETAEADAKTIIEKDLLKLFQPGADGNVLASSNQGFISALVQATGDASLVDSNNRPTEATRSRIRRALLAMLVGEGDNARDIVRGLVEDAKDLGMKTEVDGIVRASPDIVTVARDRPQYALLDEIGMALRMYMDMKREGSSPFQADLFGRPEAVDLIVKALWSRSSAGAIADIFSDYATRARLVDTSTAGLGLDKDPTKDELLKAAIAATGTGETAEQAQKKKAEEAAAESPEAPPPTQEQRAIEKKGAAPTATGQELRDAIAAQATPEPAKYDPEPNAPPTTGDMKEALPNMDELRFWRETPTLPMSRNPDVLGAAKILPYMLAGNKSHIYAHHHDMFEAVVQGAPAFVDCFGGAATYLYNLANAGVLPDNSTWNEWEYTRHVTTKQIKENPEGVIAALDALSDRLEQAIPPGSRVGAEIDSTRDAIMGWLNAELRGEHGVAYVPSENAEDAEGRTVMLDTPESAALYLLVQNISYSARAQDVSMYEGKPTWTTAGDDAKLHPTDGKLLTLVDAKGKWGVSFRLAYPADIIRKASKNLQKVNVTQRDGWSLASDLDVAPDGAVVTIDTSYFGAQNYGLKTREDGDMDTWLAKVRKYLLPHKDRLTFLITNNWNFHAVNELQKMGFLVARTERAGESPELVAMSGRARHIIAPAIRTVDYLGQKVNQEGGDQARLSVGISRPDGISEWDKLWDNNATLSKADDKALREWFDEDMDAILEHYIDRVPPRQLRRKMAKKYKWGKGIVNDQGGIEFAPAHETETIGAWDHHVLFEKDIKNFGLIRHRFTLWGGDIIWTDKPSRIHSEAVGAYFSKYGTGQKQSNLTDRPDLRFSVSAKGLKALTTGVYKQQSSEVLADLARLPASLKPYVAKYDDADELINLSGFAGWKPGPKVAPPHIWPYRPAVRLADGSIAWHDKARTHAQALQMWLEQEGRDIQTFDIDDYYADGGLGPDGRYYEKSYIGDGVSDFVEGRETGRFSVQARQPAMRDSVLYEGQARFSVKANAPSSTAQDAEYMAAVERGDMETAQRIVDEAAKKAGYTIGPVYHGTPRGEFFQFDPDMIGTASDHGYYGKGFYFTSDKSLADDYAERTSAGTQPKTINAYVGLKNPFVIDWRTVASSRQTRELAEKTGVDFNLSGYAAYADGWREKLINAGYDGVIAYRDDRAQVEMVAFSPSQIKLADPITRDDTGRIIPPSERFNPERDDIRYSVKAYPNLYRDVLSKHPASAKLDGNKAWLTLDGKWINVDEHRDAVPFDDGIYADIGVQEMAEAGLVRVHWVNFSSMPGGVMYAEHAPGQLTRAQRKELEDTAIERGGEVEYDPGQAWIRQPPPRYSFTAHAPKWSGNTTAIASLAVQHLMGEELNIEMAERSMRLHRVEDATADQLIAHAKKYAESEVGKAAAKYLEGKDPSHAITTIAQQAELDAIAAAKEGIQTGLKMGRKAMKAEMDAEKRLIRDARGENLHTLIVDTGVDMGETMFQTLPELFSEWEKPKDEGPQQPEGPRQVQPEVEPPPADPAVLAERDRRMRNLIDAARAWGDQERAKREKLAEERRKAQQEASEKGEKPEDAEEAEEMLDESDELAIPKELLQAHGVDLRNSKELARFLRLWIADWIVRTSKGRLTHQTVWKDREAVEQYRKTMMEQMTEMGHKLVEPEGYALVHITTMIQEIPSTAKPDTIERRASAILSVIQANAIRQTRAQLVAEILKDIDREMVQHKHFQPMEQDIKRKVTGEHELTARYLKKILSWSPQKIDREVAEIQQKLADRTQIYQEDGKDGQPLNVSLDAEYHRNLMKLGVLQRWGGIKRKLPAEIKQAGIEIRGWTAKAQERLYARWLKHEQAVAALVDAMNDGIVPDNPDQARKVWGAIEDWSQSNLVHLRHRLEGLIRQQHDPVKRQKAMDAIDEIMYQITRGTEVYRVLHHKYVKQFQDAVREVSGGTVASAIEYMKHLEEEIDPDIAKQISRQGFTGEDGGQVMTYNQAMQLYAELTQRHYAGNVKLHKREEHAALIESIMTTADLKLINRLRQIYEARRKELSEAVQQITGLPVWRPDPLYMPVRVLMGPKGGLGVIGNPQSWQPLAKSLTPRQHHGRDFDETATLTGTFYDSAEDAARAIGYGVRGLTVRGVLGHRAIQENIERYYGGDRLREMLKQTTHALDGVPKTGRDANDKLVNRIRELNAYAALSWNPLTAMKQTISFPMFAAVLPDGFVGVGKAIANFDRQALAELMESDWYKARYKGGINPEVAEILADSRSGYIAKFYKAGMSLVQIGDFVPSAIVATGIYRAKRDAFIDQGMNPEQAKQRASTLTGELIELTQQSSRPENMPNVYREGTGWGKLFLQFASAPLSQFSHEFHAAQDFRAGVEGSGARLVRTVMLNHVIIPGLLRMVTSLFHFLIGRPPKEDEPLFLMLLDHAIGGAMSRLLIVGAIAETVYDAAVEGKISFGAGRMVPAEALNRTIAYGIRSARDLLWEQDMEAFLSDLWKMLEGMSAPLRYGGELYRNRIAQ